MFSGSQTLSAQQIQSGTGAPAGNFEVANGSRTFTVTVLGGTLSSGTTVVTLPAGYLFDSGSASGSGGLTVSQASASGNTATLNLSGIPATGNTATFTYSAHATCAAIGTSGNQASYVFTPTGGSAQPEKLSNAFNLTNAKINITNLANAPAAAGVVGDNYTRTFRINNNGFGNIDTVYVTDVSGTGVEHVSHSVSATNNGATVTVDLLSTSTAGSNTTYLYRFIVSGTAQGSHLGQNEYFTFTQNLKIAACGNLNSSINAWYGTGPNPAPCVPQNDTQTTALAIDNSKQPNLVITSLTSATPVCRGVPVTREFKVANTGTAPAKDILLRLLHFYATGATEMPGNTLNFNSIRQIGYVPGSFRYKIGASGTYVSVPVSAASGVTLNNQKFFSQASCINTTAPAELDLLVPALAVGEEIYFQYQEINCCGTECYNSAAESAVPGSSVRYSFKNSCDTQVFSSLTSGPSTRLRNYPTEQFNVQEQFPSDMVAGTNYTLKWETLTALFTQPLYPTGSTFRYHITLPPGIALSAVPDIKYTLLNGTTLSPTNVTISGQELDITFTLGAITLTKGVLSIATVSLDCSTATGSAVVNTKVFGRSAGCTTCEQQLFCGDQSIALHCPTPCPAGMAFANFTSVRKNYGRTDNNNDGQPDASGSLSSDVRTNWVSRGDTLQFTYLGSVSDATAPLHAFKFGYADFSFSTSVSSHFSALTADVIITDASGTTVKVNKTGLPVSFNAGTGNGQVDFSIAALATPGYTSFVDGDKVTVRVSLKVTNGIGPISTTTAVSTKLYLSDAANPSGTAPNVWSCDNFSGEFTLVGIGSSNFNPTAVTLNECNTVTYTSSAVFYVGSGGNTGGPGNNNYKYEYRQFAVAGNIYFTLPAGYSLVQADLTYGRGIGGYNGTTVAINNVTPDNISGNVYTFNARKQFVDQGGPWVLPDEGLNISLRVTLLPTCGAAAVSSDLTRFEFVPGPGYSETLPAASFTPQVVNPFALTKSNLVINANSAVQTVTGNTVTWEVQVANTQPGTSPKVWLAENSGVTNGVSIQSVQPITAFGGTVSGAAIAAVGGIYQLGTYGQESRYYRITATFTNCGQDILPLAVGYVCGNYPASVDVAACRNITNLTVIPTDANLQVSLIGQPIPTYPDGSNDLCQELEYTAEVKNPAQGTAYGLQFTVQKPAGIAYVANSYQLSPTILPATATLTAISNDATYVSETATTITFTIPASVVANLPYNQGYTIRYRVRTVACDFVSGTKMTLQALGKNGCGSAINGTGQQTQAVRIKGENPNPNAYTVTSAVSGPVDGCAPAPVTYTFSAKNEGPVDTYTGESIRVTIPKPFTLGTVTDISNFAAAGAPTVTSDATSNTYTWAMPAGVAAGQTISFSAPLNATGALSCGSFAIRELVAYTFSSTCMPSGPTCSGSLQVEGENNTTTFIVNKPAYTASAFTGAANATGTGVTGSLTLTHTNAIYQAQNAVVSLFKDVDANGHYSTGDVLLGSQTFAVTSAASQTLNYDIASSYKGNICPLVALVDLGCACSDSLQLAYACDIPLPVSLVTFKAQAEGKNAVRVTWTTASELNNAFFEVQHSLNAREFETAGQVAGNGTTQQKHSYSFLHEGLEASHVHYYRLKQVDADGKFQYSSTISVVLPGYEGLRLQVTPNPIAGRLIRGLVTYGDDELDANSDIELRSSEGTLLAARRLPLHKGTNEVAFSTDGMPAGVYVLTLKHPSLPRPQAIRVVVRQ